MTPASRPFTLSAIGEFGLIRELQKQCRSLSASVIQGIGDDAALLRGPSKEALIASTDLAIEGVHFDLKFESLKDVGFRTAVANISDIAAMGGVPTFLLVGMAVPPSCLVKEVQSLYRGFTEACRKYDIALIGGDTSSSQSGLFLCVTILGHVKTKQALRRNGAKIGDRVYVTGTLGDSNAGLRILRRQAKRKTYIAPKWYEAFLTKRHLRPTPRLAIAQHLSNHGLAHAAMDLSDGLSGDIHHLCQASHVGVELWADCLPLSRQCQAYALAQGLDPVDLAVAGGEDYELLFTIPPRHQNTMSHLSRKFKVPVACIGEIQRESFGLTLKFEGGISRNIGRHSYDHFSQYRFKI